MKTENVIQDKSSVFSLRIIALHIFLIEKK
jgi:hypothetical protein